MWEIAFLMIAKPALAPFQRIGALALMCLFLLLSVMAQANAQTPGGIDNPFLRNPAQTAPDAAPARPAWPPRAAAPTSQAAPQAPAGEASPGVFDRFWKWIQQTQYNLHRKLAQGMRRLRDEQAASAAFALILLSFVYGVVHAIGPGHGKAVISSYVLANERTVRRGILLAVVASVVQALSAIAVVSVLAIALNAAGFQIKEKVSQLETASYGLIALIGGWMLVEAVRSRLRARSAALAEDGHHAHAHDRAHAQEHGRGDTCGCGHQHMPHASEIEADWSLRKAAAIVLAVGIRPCSGAIIVLVFALAQGMFWAGVVSTFAMSLGTAITVSSFAALAVGSRKAAVRLGGSESVWAERIQTFAAFGGALLVLLLGITLFAASFGPARPF